jgi:hypothetical protein
MLIVRTLRDISQALARRFAGREFTCGDCEFSTRCGKPPTADCIHKAEQIERDPTGYRRRMKARATLLKAAWPL